MRAEAAEDLRRCLVRGAVGAVEQHPATAEVERREALVEGAQVVLERAWKRRTRPILGAWADASIRASISASVASESLKPSPPKNLIPLS